MLVVYDQHSLVALVAPCKLFSLNHQVHNPYETELWKIFITTGQGIEWCV